MASHLSLFLPALFFAAAAMVSSGGDFIFEEATISEIQSAFADGRLTSTQLVQHYLNQITALNPKLNAVLEVNPDAVAAAASADLRRGAGGARSLLDGIPVLVKDSISTRDKLNTTSGSLALLGSVVPRDAGVVSRLRAAGAVILGKASMSEWDHFRSLDAPQGWSPRGGQGRNPYSGNSPCGTSSGSAIAVAANLAAVSLGTDLFGSITCPAGFNSVVGFKPTAGLTSRSGIMPISPMFDTVGPMARTVEDAAALLDVIAGYDPLDAQITAAAVGFIPRGGFRRALNPAGLGWKRLGILRHPYFDFPAGSVEEKTFASHFETMRLKGAELIDNLKIKNEEIIQNFSASGQSTVLLSGFKISVNAYLKDLVSSPSRSLADVIAFNSRHPTEEMMGEYGQEIFLASEETKGIGEAEKAAMKKMEKLSEEGMYKLMKDNRLDALVFPLSAVLSATSIGGFPVVSVPAGYSGSGQPFGIFFTGLRGSDSKLIEIAYAFEQATNVRKPPNLSLL